MDTLPRLIHKVYRVSGWVKITLIGVGLNPASGGSGWLAKSRPISVSERNPSSLPLLSTAPRPPGVHSPPTFLDVATTPIVAVGSVVQR